VRKVLLGFLTVIILFGALYSGALFFTTVRALVAQTSLPFTENVVPSQHKPETAAGAPARSQDLPDIVQRQERVNILLLGIDQRESDKGPWRTDTMILVSIDPATNSASMLSIPRDLWVTIPGYGESRVNMAHFMGDAKNYPGGGVALAQKTVWYALGVPVHYYARINFDAFERMVDAIGGITINVERAIHDESYPDNNYGTMVIDIPAGVQTMDGRTALQYARSRHGTGDFDRMNRQQAVIIAARDKVLSLDIPLSSIPKMLDIVGDSVKTNLTLKEMYALAEMVKKIDPNGIKRGAIDGSMTTTVVTPEGWMVEVPDWDKVRVMVDTLFPAPSQSTAPTPSLIQAQLANEGARIALENGTLTEGLAQTMAEKLREQGYNVVRIDNARRFDHAQTVLVAYSEMPYTVQALAEQFSISQDRIRTEGGGADGMDIVVILGRDALP
jgi:polyisoprenyl-teichoic acid--peptidoglycan teichoic acid transferase